MFAKSPAKSNPYTKKKNVEIAIPTRTHTTTKKKEAEKQHNWSVDRFIQVVCLFFINIFIDLLLEDFPFLFLRQMPIAMQTDFLIQSIQSCVVCSSQFCLSIILYNFRLFAQLYVLAVSIFYFLFLFFSSLSPCILS